MELQLTRKKKPGALVGLEIEADSIAAAEVRVNGSIEVKAAAVEPLPAGTFQEGEVTDPDSLADALRATFSRHELGKRVRIGIANQRVVVRTVRLPAIEDPKELAAAVRFQAQEQMAMPLDEAVLEHQLVGGVPAEEGSTPQLDVLVVAARRDMIASILEPVRRAGLQPVGIDLSVFGMLRAVAGEVLTPSTEAGLAEALTDAILYCNVGEVANLAVARGRACLFTRVSGVGLGSIAAELSDDWGLSLEHAGQWLAHVGLDRPVEGVDGDPGLVADVRGRLAIGVSALVDELRLSLDYYGGQLGAVPVTKVVFSGSGISIPGVVSHVEAGLGLPIEAVTPAVLAGYGEGPATRLTVPYGLALEF
ncbi:MAG: type IV pilus assembly protein PilM [Solirubrobacterales bacterium]